MIYIISSDSFALHYYCCVSIESFFRENLKDDKELDEQREGGVPHKWPRDEENHNDHDVSMEP